MIGYIYQLNSPNYCYIGSTKCTLNQRFNVHKITYMNNTSSITSRKLFDDDFDNNFENISIELLDEIDYNDRMELFKKERYYIENFNNETKTLVNKNIPSRTRKEYEKMRNQKPERKLYSNNRKKKSIICDNCNKPLKYGSLTNHKKICLLNENEN